MNSLVFFQRLFQRFVFLLASAPYFCSPFHFLIIFLSQKFTNKWNNSIWISDKLGPWLGILKFRSKFGDLAVKFTRVFWGADLPLSGCFRDRFVRDEIMFFQNCHFALICGSLFKFVRIFFQSNHYFCFSKKYRKTQNHKIGASEGTLPNQECLRQRLKSAR